MMASCICGQYGGCAGKQIPANNRITKANLLVVRDKLAIEIKAYDCTHLHLKYAYFFCEFGRFNMGICGGCLTFRSDSSGRSRNCSFWCFTLNLKCSTSKLQPKYSNYFLDWDALVGLYFPPLNMKTFCQWLLITNFEGVTLFLAFLATLRCQKYSCFHKLKQKINKTKKTKLLV